MIGEWSFYDREGRFTGRRFVGSEKLLERNTPVGCKPIAGRFNRETQRVDLETGKVVETQIAEARAAL